MRRTPLTEEQQQYVLDHYRQMTLEDLSVALSLKTKYRVQAFLNDKGLKRDKEVILTEEQKEFIRKNYRRLSEPELARRCHLKTRSIIQKFKREEGLRVRKVITMKPKAKVVEGEFFNVDEKKMGWVI